MPPESLPEQSTPPNPSPPEPKQKEAPQGVSSLLQDLLPVAALWVAVVVGFVLIGLFFKEPIPSTKMQVDKDGIPIIYMDQEDVVQRVASDKPLNEPEARAVFRWVVGHPEEAATLSAEEKAAIIRSLNE